MVQIAQVKSVTAPAAPATADEVAATGGMSPLEWAEHVGWETVGLYALIAAMILLALRSIITTRAKNRAKGAAQRRESMMLEELERAEAAALRRRR